MANVSTAEAIRRYGANCPSFISGHAVHRIAEETNTIDSNGDLVMSAVSGCGLTNQRVGDRGWRWQNWLAASPPPDMLCQDGCWS